MPSCLVGIQDAETWGETWRRCRWQMSALVLCGQTGLGTNDATTNCGLSELHTLTSRARSTQTAEEALAMFSLGQSYSICSPGRSVDVSGYHRPLTPRASSSSRSPWTARRKFPELEVMYKHQDLKEI